MLFHRWYLIVGESESTSLPISSNPPKREQESQHMVCVRVLSDPWQ